MMGQGRIIKKLLGQPVNDNKSEANLSFGSRADKSYLRPINSQNASYNTGSPLSCLDQSADGDFAVVAGEKVFQILKVDGLSITEETDLRAVLSNNAGGQNDSISVFKDKLNIRSAKWMHGALQSTIVTASAHGKMALYDLNRPGSELEVGRIKEHDREVHTIAVNPHRTNTFATACHDGTVRLFDINESDLRPSQIFKSKATYRSNADAIRDLKWSPRRGWDFACSTSSGSVQYWDRRQLKAPLLNLKSAHRGACMSISWHPDGTHVISGGHDQKCHVWDLSGTGEKRQAPKYTIATPAPVSRVSWRFPCWSPLAQAKRAAQVVVAYDDSNPVNTKVSTIHIWDLARPSLPYKEICDFETSPSGLIWHDREILWSVNRSGTFNQIDIGYAPKVIDRRSLSTFDFSPSGDVLMLLEERKGRSRSTSPAPSETEPHMRKKLSSGHNQSPSSNPLHGGSRSESDDELLGSFLGGKGRSKLSRRRQSSRSVNSLSTTPPTAPNVVDEHLMGLEDGVKVAGPYKPQQIMAIGHTPSTARRNIYQFLSSRYLEAITFDKHDALSQVGDPTSLSTRLVAVLEQLAMAAAEVGHFRLAQTWKILGYTMSLLLQRRAEYHRKIRLARVGGTLLERPQKLEVERKESHQKLADGNTSKQTIEPKSALEIWHPVAKSIIAEEMESTSNMTTPMARPVRDSQILDRATNEVSSVENDELSLPPAAHSTSPPSASIDAQASPDDQEASLTGYDFYDTSSLSTQAIDIAAPPSKKAPFRLDYDEAQQAKDNLGSTARHDSVESFEMFSTSADSRRARFPGSIESLGHGSMPIVSQEVSEVDSSWDSSGPVDSGEYISHTPSDNDRQSAIEPPTIHFQDSNVSARTESDEAAMLNAAIADARLEEDAKVDESDPHIIDRDYYPLPSDPPSLSFVSHPIDPHILVQRTLQFEVKTGVLNAAAIILLLKPFLNQGTIDDYQAEAILSQYHHRLTTMELFSEAALLRKLSYPEYQNTYSLGLHNIQIAFVCPSCNAPMGDEVTDSSSRLEKCTQCNTYLSGCAICEMFEPHDIETFDLDAHQSGVETASNRTLNGAGKETARLWWYCQGCGHGGHTSCMSEWHGLADAGPSPSEGCCPIAGCLHACLPGTWRDEQASRKKQKSSDQTGRLVVENLRIGAGAGRLGSPGGGTLGGAPAVKMDGLVVAESRAVESVRTKLSVGGGGGGGGSGGAGTGVASGAVGPAVATSLVPFTPYERKKSVKVVAPGEERTR